MLRDAALHAAVLAAPDEDAPRLVYADWLLERGDPRGELITTQVTIAKRPDDAALLERERELMRLHRVTWIEPVRRMWPRFNRGFVEAISIDALELEIGDAICDACIRELEVRAVQKSQRFDPLVAALPRTAVRKIAVHYGQLPTFAFAEVLEAPELARLEALAFQSVELDRALLPVLHAAALPALRELALSACHLDAEGLAQLGTWQRPLRALDISHNGVGKRAIATALAGPAFRALEALDCRATLVDSDDVAELCALDLPLASLNLALCAIGPRGAATIAAWPGGARLRSLGLADAGIGREGLAALVASPYLPQGMTLGLDGDLLGLETRGSRWVGEIAPELGARFDIVIDGEPAY